MDMKKKKTIIFLVAGLLSVSAHAQTDDKMDNIDWQEDSTEIVSVQDIINEQQQLTAHHLRESHFSDVWRRNSYINLSYTTSELEPDCDILAGYKNEKLGTLKSKWGLSFQSGRSYRLHKEPIANTVQLNIDYTWIDLTVNYFEKIGDGPFYYNSLDKRNGEDDTYMMPWNLKKYEASYGMNIGPSISICPFNYIDVPQLHYLQLHFYYHIGYQLTGILISNDEDADENIATGYSDEAKRHKQMKDNLKGEWGHGLMNSFGFSVTWKRIGIGYEHVSAKPTLKPLTTGDFGKDDDKFKISRSRLFIQFRM